MQHSSPDAPTLRIEARFKNARLFNAILAAAPPRSMHGADSPVARFCRRRRLSYTAVLGLLNLKLSPLIVSEVRPICDCLSTILEQPVEWLFPAELYAVDWPALAIEGNHRPLMLSLGERETRLLSLPPAQDDVVAESEIRHRITSAVSTLKPRLQLAVTLRYGLDGQGERTIEEVGAALGVTTERARQIILKALSKLRHPTRSRQLRNLLRYEFLPEHKGDTDV